MQPRAVWTVLQCHLVAAAQTLQQGLIVSADLYLIYTKPILNLEDDEPSAAAELS